jgi:hypothetical protein
LNRSNSSSASGVLVTGNRARAARSQPELTEHLAHVRYVLVEAENEAQARERGQAALEELYAELRRQFDAEMPVNVLTVRPATSDEIEFSRWNEETLAREEMGRRV